MPVSQGFGNFSLELLCEIIEFCSRQSERFEFVSKHALGGFFDALSEVIDYLSGLFFRSCSLGHETSAKEFARHVDRTVRLGLICFSYSIVQLFRQQRLRMLGLLGDTPHVCENICEAGFLLG